VSGGDRRRSALDGGYRWWAVATSNSKVSPRKRRR